MTTPTLIGTPTTTVANVATTTMRITAPAGITAGNVMVFGWELDTNTSVAAPASVTLVNRRVDTAQGNDESLQCYTRVSDGSESGSTYGFTAGAAVSFCGFCAVVQNCVATTTPNAVSSNSGTGSTATAPSISTDTASTMLMAIYGVDTSPPGTVTFSSGNMSTRVINISATSWANIGMFTDVFNGIGSTGTRSASTTGGSLGWMGILLAFAASTGAVTSASQVVEFYGNLTMMGVM